MRIIGVERAHRILQATRGVRVHAVVDLGTIDRDDGDAAVLFDANRCVAQRVAFHSSQ